MSAHERPRRPGSGDRHEHDPRRGDHAARPRGERREPDAPGGTNAPRGNDADRPGEEVVRDALRWLTGAGRPRDDRTLLAELRARFAGEGRARLGQLVYEVGRACVAACPDAATRTWQPSAPRPPEVVAPEAATMARCLCGVAATPDLGGLPAATPGEAQALDALDRCTELLRRVEGPTSRQRILEAYAAILRGEPVRAEAVLRAVLDDPATSAGHAFFARVNLSLALHRQERAAEALALADEVVDERPDFLPPRFSQVSSAADLGALDRAERGIRTIVHLARDGDAELARRFLVDELRRMTERLRLGEDVLARMRAAAAPLLGTGGGA